MSRGQFKTNVTEDFFKDPAPAKKDTKKKAPAEEALQDPEQNQAPAKPSLEELQKQLQELQKQIPTGYRIVKENKTERMQFLVRPTAKNYLQEQAKEQGISVNELVNNIFEDYMERNSD